MSVVRVKDGVEFLVIAPGGFRLLHAIDQTAKTLGVELTITSACDGVHSGPSDPHHRGEAYDVRSQGFTEDQKTQILNSVLGILDVGRFFGFLEAAGSSNEHFHFQVRRGTEFP